MFCERRVSGKAQGMLAGAMNCLLVSVTADEVWITPIFPFNFLDPFGFFKLEHRWHRKQVAAEPMTSWAAANVCLAVGATQLELRLRDPQAFLEAIARR